MNQHLFHVTKTPTSLHTIQVLILWPGFHAWLNTPLTTYFVNTSHQIAIGNARLPTDGRWPLIIIGGKEATRTQNTRDFSKSWLRLHPMQRLRAGDNVGT